MSHDAHDKGKMQFYDLNVPLTTASSSSKRKHQAHIHQTRLRHLGYHGIAFCHTAYGRLNVDRDDADVALPWKDLVTSSSPSRPPESSLEYTDEASAGTDEISFGRTNSFGMKIHRRLNIIVEEVSDVSRILLPVANSNTNADATTTTDSSKKEPPSSAISTLLQKYDIVSLQPMNEPALQNICELLSSSSSNDAVSSSVSLSSNNVHLIDILTLEYATGSRGGYSLPYKLRKDYVVKTLQAGVTFELCYGTAIVDPKRRQGFLRTVIDFKSSYNGIQKKHMLLNKQICHQKRKSDKFPLLLSSGPRKNYTQGTDEGALVLRSPNDVKSFVCHFVGNHGWFDKEGDDNGGNDQHRIVDRKGNNKKRQIQATAVSAAERVLARASERALSVVVVDNRQRSSIQGKRKQRGWESRSYVAGMTIRTKRDATGRSRVHENDSEYDEEEDGDDTSNANISASSLVDWLSETLRQKERSENEIHNVTKTAPQANEKEAISDRDGTDNNDDVQAENPSSTNVTKTAALTAFEGKHDEEFHEDDEENVEDGFIAL